MKNSCRTGNEICLPDSDLPRVVIVGGGFAGIALVNKLGNKPVQIVVLDKNNFHQFQPLLYQVATSGIEPDSIVFPLRKLFNGYRNVCYRMAEVQTIQSGNNTLITNIGAVEFDYLIVATGSSTNFFGLKDVEDNSTGMKTIQEALDIRSLVLQNLENAVTTCDEVYRDALTNFAIVGGGPAGVETAGAIAEFKKYILPKDYPELDASMMSIYLIEASNELLGTMSDKSSEYALLYLKKMGVQVMLDTAVQSYDGQVIKTNNRAVLKAKTLVWTAGVIGNVPNGINREAIVRGNRILVNNYSKVKGTENIYAIGDIAAMVTEEYPHGHPMVAQVAIQQGKKLAENILRLMQHKEPEKFIYRDKGSLATVGKRRAVADLGKFRFGGYIAWLLWSVVHLLSISGFRNKLLVALNWTWSYFTYDKGNRLIIRKYINKHEKTDNILV